MNYMEEYYSHYDEEGRLLSNHGQVEYRTTMKHIHEVAKNIGAKCILVTTGHQNRATLESVNVPVMDSLMESLDLIYERDKD